MINLELLEELISKSNSNKKLDKKFIKKIILDEISKQDKITKNDFNGIHFGETNLDSASCSYNVDFGIITINYDRLLNTVDSNDDLINNLEILQVILHELEHVKEKSKMMKKDVEGYLIELSSMDIFENITLEKLKHLKNKVSAETYKNIFNKAFVKTYDELYDLIPAERIAQINSYKYLIESLSKYPNFKEYYYDAIEYICFDYMDQYLMGYKFNKRISNIPLLDYLNSINYVEESKRNEMFAELIKKINKNSVLIEDKLKYGLKTDYYEIEKIYYKTLKYIK